MKFSQLKVAALMLLSSLSTQALAEQAQMDGNAVMAKSLAANYYGGQDNVAVGKMTITDNSGSVRIREFKMLRMDTDDKAQSESDQNYFVKFSEPSDLDGVVFMVKKHVGSNDDRWLYLPKLDLVRRIAAGDKRTSFVGSDVMYEDISGRHLTEDDHTIESQSNSYYVLKSTPKDAANVEFKYYKTWVHKQTFLALKREYYDGNDNKYRQMKAQKVGTIDDIPTITSSVVQDLNTGSTTTVTFSEVKYNIGLEDELFQERYLRTPPAKWFD